jgi:hypothetical protein
MVLGCALFAVNLASSSRAQIITNNGASVKTTSGAVVYIVGSANNATGTYDNTGTTTVTGSWTNGGTTADSGTINVAGDWINNATFTRYIGTVVMNGGAQNFSGTQITTFNNLTILGGNTKTLNIAERVDGINDLTLGILSTTQTNLLTYTTNGTWINGSSTSYIDGPAAKDFNSAVEFRLPIGKSSRFNTVAVQPNSATATTFRAEYFYAPYVNTTTMILPLKKISKIHYWNIDQTSGTSNAQVRLYWISGDYNLGGNNLINTATLEVARWTGAAWTGEGKANVTGNFVSGNIQSNVVTTWGLAPNEHFTIGGDSTENGLPVELDHFAARQEGSHVKLEWRTRSEIDNLGYEIERSSTTETYGVIQSWEHDKALMAKSVFGAEYQTLDDPPLDGEWKYDLYQRDMNGTRTHIASQTLIYQHLNVPADMTIQVYPNPVVERAQILLAMPTSSASVRLELYDPAGRRVLNIDQGVLAQGSHSLVLEHLSQFASGVYTIVMTADQQRIAKPLVIAR